MANRVQATCGKAEYAAVDIALSTCGTARCGSVTGDKFGAAEMMDSEWMVSLLLHSPHVDMNLMLLTHHIM